MTLARRSTEYMHSPRTTNQSVSLYRTFSVPQFKVLLCISRFIVLVAGRRWGKTTVALYKMLCHAVANPSQLCYFIAPTGKQAREIAWRKLLELTPSQFVSNVDKSRLGVELVNGSTIMLHGPGFLRGVGLDYVVLDEFAFMDPFTWTEVVLPMLADREGRALICSTPNGFNHFYDMYNDAKTKQNWAVFHFATRHGSLVPPPELALLRESMDSRTYNQEIEARFEPHEGRVYYAFAREGNVAEVVHTHDLPLLVGMDFNVDPMTAVITQKVGNNCHVLDEIVLRNSNTPEMMAELCRRYPDHRGLVHPDPSGSARKTSAAVGVTDHAIIEQFGWDVYPMKPYPVIDRIAAVNALLRSASGDTRLRISPKCTHLIRALEGLTYKEGTRIPDKSSGFQHISDALGYLAMAVFPIVNRNGFSIRNAFTGEDLMN